MIDLPAHDHDALRAIVAAGDEGLTGCRDIALSTLCRLDDLGLAQVDFNLRKLKAKATTAGRAFMQRDAA